MWDYNIFRKMSSLWQYLVCWGEVTSRSFPHKNEGMDRRGEGREQEKQRDTASDRDKGEAERLRGHIPKLSPVS